MAQPSGWLHSLEAPGKGEGPKVSFKVCGQTLCEPNLLPAWPGGQHALPAHTTQEGAKAWGQFQASLAESAATCRHL